MKAKIEEVLLWVLIITLTVFFIFATGVWMFRLFSETLF